MGLLDAPTFARGNRGKEQIEAINARAMLPWWTAIAGRDTAPANWCGIGDSITSGANATAVANRWTAQVLRRLRSAFPVAGVVGAPIGYEPATFSPWAAPGGDKLVTAAAGVGTFGLGIHSRILQAGMPGTYTFTGTSFDLYWTKGSASGTFTVTVDGGAPSAAQGSAANPAAALQVYNSGALAYGTHTVVVTQVTGTPWIEGFYPYNGDETKGIRYFDAGHYGTQVSGFTGSAGANLGQMGLVAGGNFQSKVSPQLVSIALGINDRAATTPAVPAATFKANVLTLVGGINASGDGSLATKCAILLLAVYDKGIVGPSGEPWSAYVEAMYEVQDVTANVAVLDLSTRMQAANVENMGNVDVDHTHPTDKGHKLISSYVFNAIAPPARSDLGNMLDLVNSKSQSLTMTAVKTGVYVPADGEMARFDTSGGVGTINLPALRPDRTRWGAKLVIAGNTLTINAAAGDVFNRVGGPTSLTMSMANQAMQFQYDLATRIITVIADDQPLGGLDARYDAAGAATAAVTALVNSAPAVLDTLEEIADALGDDGNFAATMTAALAGKSPVPAQGLRSARPAAAASTGKFYLSTNINGGTLEFSDGSAWIQVARGLNERAVRDIWPIGTYLEIDSVTKSAALAVDGVLNMRQFDVPLDVTIDRFGFQMTAVGVGSPVVRAGLYTDADGDGIPDTLLVDFGTVAAAIQVAEITGLAQVIPAGPVWGGVVSQGGATPVTFEVATSGRHQLKYSATPATMAGTLNIFQKTAVNGALPASIAPTLTTGSAPLWMLRRSA